ncbi:MAG: DUF3078 domain-containing protein [Bacteroidales bacterium]|jgi:hypothetical protein|nr:DUF3078 domain-containing protein [Bacteroidales bacterium]MDD4672344.1 DUF3078 domain-containing protein [Bacteroidales bacterium]MDY0348940.1 DUF3078 domain-containing protein [Tenuifilaceae bacterium]
MRTKFTFIATLVLCIFSSSAISQVTEAEKVLLKQNADSLSGWKTGGIAGVNVAQTALANWAAGGEGSFAVNGVFSLFANYKKGNLSWDNSFDLGYGVLKQEDSEFRKTDDKIDILSKFGRKAYNNLYYAGLFNFKSQMTQGYNYNADGTKDVISNAFAPAYIIAAIGIDYKPNDYFSMFAAPITGKMTIVNDERFYSVGAFGVEEGEKTLNEFGGYVRFIFSKGDFTQDFLKNISITSKLDLFSNYLEKPQNIVVNWENIVAFKVNKYMNINLNTHLIYDDKIDIAKEVDGVVESFPRVQFKEIFGLGVSFKF